MHNIYIEDIAHFKTAFSLQVTLGSVSPNVTNGFSLLVSHTPAANGLFSPPLMSKVFDVHCCFSVSLLTAYASFSALKMKAARSHLTRLNLPGTCMLNKGSKEVTMVKLFFASTEHHAQGDEVGEADEAEPEAKPKAGDVEEGNVGDKAVGGMLV